jgi:hypothetical protein
MTTEKVFADGFSFKRRESAPDFVIGNVSIKVDEAVPFLQKNAKNGWVNLNVLTAKSGKQYIELDQWEPNKEEVTKQVNPVAQDDDLPF